jgi:hypothetical protein
VADALSRRLHDSQELHIISSVSHQWLQSVQASYAKDAHAQDLITKLALSSVSIPNFSLQQGLVRYKNRVWVGQDKSLQQHLISALHDSAVGGHSGMPVTYRRMKQAFSW